MSLLCCGPNGSSAQKPYSVMFPSQTIVYLHLKDRRFRSILFPTFLSPEFLIRHSRNTIKALQEMKLKKRNQLTQLLKGSYRVKAPVLASSSFSLLETDWTFVERCALWSSISLIKASSWSLYAALNRFLTRSSADNSWIFLSFSSWKHVQNDDQWTLWGKRVGTVCAVLISRGNTAKKEKETAYGNKRYLPKPNRFIKSPVAIEHYKLDNSKVQTFKKKQVLNHLKGKKYIDNQRLTRWIFWESINVV